VKTDIAAASKKCKKIKGEVTMATDARKLVERVIAQIEHLPTLPQVVANLLAMTESPSVDAMKLSKALDQSLAAKVLKVANSAFYGKRKVNTIAQGIVIIGFDAVKEIILTTSLFHTFHDARDIQSLQPLWQHSLECAMIAKRLGWIYRYEILDEAYFCGLIHDIGKLVIQQYFPEADGQIHKLVEGGVESLDAEREILSISHAEIGGKMVQRWNFPPAMVDAVNHHHDQDWKLNPRLGRILYYANLFVLGLVNFTEMLAAMSKTGMSFPGNWDPFDLQEVEQILRQEIKKASSMLEESKG
jgi:putative nucleotidyltransferase with HDIG domain